MRICVCTLCCGTARSYGDLSIEINRAYCAKHGYDFVIEYNSLDANKHPYWSKILLLQRELNKNYDYVMFVDADAVFTNFDTKVESFIGSSSIYAANENLSVSDRFGLNSGVILLRNDSISKKFLQDVWDRYEGCKDSCVPEQLAMALEMESSYKEYVTQYPCIWFNAYYGPFAESINRPWCLWRPGCYIKHLLMCSTEFRKEEFNRMLAEIK